MGRSDTRPLPASLQDCEVKLDSLAFEAFMLQVVPADISSAGTPAPLHGLLEGQPNDVTPTT